MMFLSSCSEYHYHLEILFLILALGLLISCKLTTKGIFNYTGKYVRKGKFYKTVLKARFKPGNHFCIVYKDEDGLMWVRTEDNFDDEFKIVGGKDDTGRKG